MPNQPRRAGDWRLELERAARAVVESACTMTDHGTTTTESGTVRELRPAHCRGYCQCATHTTERDHR